MQEHTAKLVYPVLTYGVRLKIRVDAGDMPDLDKEQAVLKGLLGAGSQVDQWGGSIGDSDLPGLRRTSRPAFHYALVCWLDEIFSDESAWGVQWSNNILEHALYGTRLRADRFWDQARRAEASAGDDDVEVFYLCAMLGFRGTLRDDPDRLVAWCEAVERRLAEGMSQDWPTRPPEREAPSYAPPLRGQERLERMLSIVITVLLLLIPAVTFFLVYQLR